MTMPVRASPPKFRVTGFVLEEEEDTSIEASASARIANAGSIALFSNSASGINKPVGVEQHATAAPSRLKPATTSPSAARKGASSRSGAVSENVGRRAPTRAPVGPAGEDDATDNSSSSPATDSGRCWAVGTGGGGHGSGGLGGGRAGGGGRA